MFVVVWEPKRGGGGHQLAVDQHRAELVSRALCRALPDAEVKVMPAEVYAASAVVEHQQRKSTRGQRAR